MSKVPVARLAAEAVVVVVSILLAFAIDAWWEGRGQALEERRVLTALLDEARANSETIARNLAFHEHGFAASSIIVEQAAMSTPDIPSDSLDVLMAVLSAWTVSDWERAALDTALEGGAGLIRDPAVRSAVRQWQRALDAAVESSADEVYFARDVWFPWLRENGHMAQMFNTGWERVEDWRTPPTPMGPPVDHRSLFGNREFVNVVLERRMNYDDMRYFQSELRTTVDHLIEALEVEAGG